MTLLYFEMRKTLLPCVPSLQQHDIHVTTHPLIFTSRLIIVLSLTGQVLLHAYAQVPLARIQLQPTRRVAKIALDPDLGVMSVVSLEPGSVTSGVLTVYDTSVLKSRKPALVQTR